VDGGEYTYSGAVGTWTGNAASVVFTAASNQVRATQIVVTLAGGTTGVEDVTTVVIPVKVMKNGQLMIIRGENAYNVMGAQVK
jgi:phage baseplate assembly protein gpV